MIRIAKRDRALTEDELTEHERNGDFLIAVNSIIEMEYSRECFAPGMPPSRVRYWVYHFRAGMAQ